MNYEFYLTITSELDEIVAEIKANSLESLEEQLRKAEHAIKKYEADKKDELAKE